MTDHAPCARGNSVERREFLQQLAGTGVAGLATWQAAEAWAQVATAPSPDKPKGRTVKVGLVGAGGRGRWIARLFQSHGGFQLAALADFFAEVAEQAGEALGVDKKFRFAGLKSYQKVLDSGVEAIVLQTPPCFFPEMAQAAVDAGVHIYMAKPVAVDVPGCQTIAAAGRQATAKNLVFLVDYQLPTDPVAQKVAHFIRSGALGPLARVSTVGVSGGHADPPRGKTIASRLRDLIWTNDIPLGGGSIISYDIHAFDVAVWILGRAPAAAVGTCRIARPEPRGGDNPDLYAVVYEYEDGLLHDHWSQHLPNRTPSELSFKVFSYSGRAWINYYTNAGYEIREKERFEQTCENVHDAGAQRNIAEFYRRILEGPYDNPTVGRGVTGCLAAILGREACLRNSRVTMAELLAENRKLPLDLTGLEP